MPQQGGAAAEVSAADLKPPTPGSDAGSEAEAAPAAGGWPTPIDVQPYDPSNYDAFLNSHSAINLAPRLACNRMSVCLCLAAPPAPVLPARSFPPVDPASAERFIKMLSLAMSDMLRTIVLNSIAAYLTFWDRCVPPNMPKDRHTTTDKTRTRPFSLPIHQLVAKWYALFRYF